MSKKDKILALKLGIQTYQILSNNDEVCIPSLSSILVAVPIIITNFRGKISSQNNVQDNMSILCIPAISVDISR